MKKNLPEELKRMMKIMENVEGTKILTELNMQYLDQLLDKVSSGGMDSLNDYEKQALQKMSQNQDVNPPEKHSLGKTETTLRFTTTIPETDKLIVKPSDAGQTFGQARLENAYIKGEAGEIAGNELPVFIDGDLGQLDLPIGEQDIRMLTPQGEYECVAEASSDNGFEYYLITLKPDEEDEPEIDDFSMLNEDMSEYTVYKDDVTEVKDEDDMRVYNIFDDLEEEEGFASQVDADSEQMGDIKNG